MSHEVLCPINLTGPGVSDPDHRKIRDPYNIQTWGAECGRGIPYKDFGLITDGQKGAIRKISTGRKHRGMASDGVVERAV